VCRPLCASQPALLYLVPACLLFSAAAAPFVKGIKSLVLFEEHPDEGATDVKKLD
jgi:hypothetical protein